MEDKKYTGHLVFLFLMTSNVNEDKTGIGNIFGLHHFGIRN